jgi:drug/metabolite transporter (DMT)-like permease
VWIMLAAFCLLAASNWLLPSISGLLRCLTYLIVGIAAAILNARRRWQGVGGVGRLALAGVLLLGAPEVVAGWGLRHVSSNLWVVVLAAVPAMVVLVSAQTAGDGVRRLLGPALVGLGGVLLIVPLDVPGSVMGWLSLVALIVSAVAIAVASVWIHRLLEGFGVAPAVSIFCFANALVLLVRGLFDGVTGWGLSGGWWIAVLAQAIEVLLLVVLLRAMSPVRFGARYLMIPLLTVVEGYVLLRPELTLRMAFGALLLAGGAAFLLLSRGVDEGAGLSLG